MSVKATNWAWEKGRELDIPRGPRFTLVRCADHADHDGVCWPGEKGIAEYTGATDRSVRDHLDLLEGDYGLLHRERQSTRKNGRGRSADRIVLHLDQPAAASGRSEASASAPAQSGRAPAGEGGPDQPAAASGRSEGDLPEAAARPTGSLKHDLPEVGDSALVREPSEEPSERTESEKAPPSRPDDSLGRPPRKGVLDVPTGGRLSHLLADLIKANDPDGVRPTVTQKWLDAERLLVTRDGRDPEMAAHLIRWCQADGFWRGNVKSMPKFREKYRTLYDHSRRGAKPSGPSAAEERIQERLRRAA